MFNALKFMACIFKGHIVNPDESLVRDYMLDERNWLCKCHRCGIYIMHDGAMSGLEFNRQFMNVKKLKNL